MGRGKEGTRTFRSFPEALLNEQSRTLTTPSRLP
jgi:hypothetical protein